MVMAKGTLCKCLDALKHMIDANLCKENIVSEEKKTIVINLYTLV